MEIINNMIIDDFPRQRQIYIGTGPYENNNEAIYWGACSRNLKTISARFTGSWSGNKLITNYLNNRSIEDEIITVARVGYRVFIPRITFMPSGKENSFPFKWIHYLVKLIQLTKHKDILLGSICQD